MSRIVKRGGVKKMIIVATVIISIVLLLLGVLFYFAYIHAPENILRVARKESELEEGSYILCQGARVTGYSWILIQDENGDEVRDFINIMGVDPIAELNLSYEFEMGHNTFIFYVDERIVSYSEFLGEDTIEYMVTGWDILYPVRRVPYTLISPRRYILETDMRRSAREN